MRTRGKNERDNNQRAAITRYWMWHHGSWLSVRGLGSVIEKIEQWEIDRLIPYARNPRKNDHAVDKIASAIREFGFKVPIIAKSNGDVVDGHLRLKAAQKLGMDTVPVVIADDLTDAQVRAFRLSVNKMAEIADWDDELLQLELDELREMDFDLDLTGFSAEEINILFNGWETDFNPAEKHGQNLDGIEAVIKIAVSQNDQEFAKEKITNALDSAGIEYDLK